MVLKRLQTAATVAKPPSSGYKSVRTGGLGSLLLRLSIAQAPARSTVENRRHGTQAMQKKRWNRLSNRFLPTFPVPDTLIAWQSLERADRNGRETTAAQQR